MTSTAVDTRTSASPQCVRTGHEVSIARDPASTAQRLTEREAAWPGRIRRIVRAGLKHWGRPDLIDTAELLTTELVTNALRHGRGPDIGFRLYLSNDQAVIEVRDGSSSLPVLRYAAPDDEEGRGLFLVDAMADAWGVSPDGTTTWCSLSLCKGPDDPMEPVATPTPVLREYPVIGLPGNSSAVTRARTIARTGLTVIGWTGDAHAATEVLARLVDNAVRHGVTPGHAETQISARLSLNEDGELIIDVTDPKPLFPDFEAARQGENGRGLWEVGRLGAEVTWFAPPDLNGKTVRATMKPGPVDL
ncbi:ATP-binding protein [Streptomyces sp. KR55]|uniref:ATP-binding protein n=1 Tax=Streptomyces sp. KR55 TaxID=3457425 RepID=UPI003FD01903